MKTMQGVTKTITAPAFVALLTLGMLSSMISVNIVPDPYINDVFSGQKMIGSLKASENRTDVTNETRKVALNGVAISFHPQVDPALTTMTMKISDEKTGFPLTHVDWVVKIRNPEEREVFKSSTVHSHLGTNEFSYNFLEPGKNTVSVLVASNGPKLLGVDYPPIGHTRIFKSGDPLSWRTDQTYFFGTRTTEFTIDIPYSQQSNNNPLAGTTNILSRQSERADMNDTSQLSNVRVLDGSENRTKVKVELSTIPETVVAGKPVTLVLKVRSASNDTLVTHSDALLVISKEPNKLLQSAPPGSVVPINGAFHGHTGELGVTTVFPSSGVHKIDTHVFSLPLVSNYKFGHVKTSFDLNVIEGDNGTTTTSTGPTDSLVTGPANITTVIPISGELNRVAIIGQDAPFFTPDNISVKPGATLTFRNHDAVVHTATGTNDGTSVASPTPNAVFDTGLLSTGQEKQIIFAHEGTFNYFCEVHPYMRGAVIVSN
jgi:plastocyanin